MARIMDSIQLRQYDMFVRSAATKQLGANETIRQLKAAGISRRRQTVLRDYANYAQIPQKAETIKYVRKDYKISPQLYTETIMTPAGRPAFMSDTFRYTIKFETLNPDTGDVKELFHSMVSSKGLTPKQIEENFVNSLTDTVDRYKLTLTRYNIELAEHRPGDAWD